MSSVGVTHLSQTPLLFLLTHQDSGCINLALRGSSSERRASTLRPHRKSSFLLLFLCVFSPEVALLYILSSVSFAWFQCSEPGWQTILYMQLLTDSSAILTGLLKISNKWAIFQIKRHNIFYYGRVRAWMTHENVMSSCNMIKQVKALKLITLYHCFLLHFEKE